MSATSQVINQNNNPINPELHRLFYVYYAILNLLISDYYE